MEDQSRQQAEEAYRAAQRTANKAYRAVAQRTAIETTWQVYLVAKKAAQEAYEAYLAVLKTANGSPQGD